jgi:starch-binding outer membrane protein, SusD/RagB family
MVFMKVLIPTFYWTNPILEGEARFVRAFAYFYLVNLYGDVPIILSTNYRDNQLAARDPIAEVYSQIIDDLEVAAELVGSNYINGERTRVNEHAVTALLSRVYLYLEDWQQAETLSTRLINETSMYELPNELNEVFLANSKEAIWQISPIGGGQLTNTNEGYIFIIDPIFSFLAAFQLEQEFIELFGESDKRYLNWIGYHSGRNAFFAHKYKVWNSNAYPITEYSMVLRLAEQYLIRAESRARRGDLSGSIDDLDKIRERAGLDLIAESNPDITQQELLLKIFEERRKELFGEWGHRWLDLKRTGRAGEVLGTNNPNWEATDIWYPIPEEERRKNPNLSQNPGY